MYRLFNGTFYTMDGLESVHELYVDHEGFITTNQEDINDVIDIDMQGQYIYPAFVDCHLHLMGYGQFLSRLHIKGLQNKQDVFMFIKKHLDLNMIYIEHYKPSININKKDLDDISKDIPIYLRHEDYHGMTLNSKALEIMQFESEDGILKEEDATMALQSIPKNTIDTLTSFLMKAYQKLNAYGIIAGHSDDLYYFNGYHDTLQAFFQASQSHPFYNHLLVHHQTLNDHIRRPTLENDFVELGAVKMFYDGTTGSKTALMSTPYVDDTYGMRITSKETFKSQVMQARKANMAVAIHVIGDQGLLEVAEILRDIPVKKGLFDRVIHASYANQEAIHILKTLDVFLDIQPQFLTTDLPHTLNLFKDTPDMVFPFKTYHDAHIHYGYSSDAPVEDPNPLLGIYAAETRNVGEIHDKDQCMTRYDAVKAYTTHAWILSKHKGGYLKPTYPAHFVVFKEDILNIHHDRLKSLQVSETWMQGKNIYKAP